MSIVLTCPKCSAPHTVPDEVAGQTVECPACRTQFPADPVPPPRAPASGRRAILPWVIGLLLVGGAGVAAYQLVDRSTPTDFTDPDGIFSARFPNPPEAKAATKAQPLRFVWGERLWQAKAGGKEYSVAVLDGLNTGDQPYGPTTRDAQIDGIVVIAQTNSDGQMLHSRTVTHEGHPAREVALVQRDSGKLTAFRVLAGERHALRLAVSGSGDKDKPTEFLDRAGEFFNGVHVGTAFGAPIVADPPAVSAADLAAAYKADARAADAQYKDRWLRVTGTVREVAEDRTEFLMEASGSAILVRRAPQARQTVAVRGPGATVVTTGKCRGLEAGADPGPRVVLEEAIVVNRPSPK
jgi:hypothetical protein